MWGHLEKVCLRAASLYMRALSIKPGPASMMEDGRRWARRSEMAEAIANPGPSWDAMDDCWECCFHSAIKAEQTDFRAECCRWRHTVAHCKICQTLGYQGNSKPFALAAANCLSSCSKILQMLLHTFYNLKMTIYRTNHFSISESP